jgi:hypothetical protein
MTFSPLAIWLMCRLAHVNNKLGQALMQYQQERSKLYVKTIRDVAEVTKLKQDQIGLLPMIERPLHTFDNYDDAIRSYIRKWTNYPDADVTMTSFVRGYVWHHPLDDIKTHRMLQFLGEFYESSRQNYYIVCIPSTKILDLVKAGYSNMIKYADREEGQWTVNFLIYASDFDEEH